MASNLFNLDPLFNETPEVPEPRGLFQVEDLGFGAPDPEQDTINKGFEKINAQTEKSIEKIRDEGILARYPLIESPEDEAKERSRLRRRGLSPEEIDRRIEKFKTKGGKVKTSAKALAAATMLSGGIEGYLATKQGRRLRHDQGLTRLRKEAKERMDEEIVNIKDEAKEQKALLLASDEREFKKALEEIKADSRMRREVAQDARDLAIPLEDDDGNTRPIEDVTADVINEQARRAKFKEDLQADTADRLTAGEARRQASTAVQTAIQLEDPSILRDSDIAEHFNLDPRDQAAIDEKREMMSGKLRLMTLKREGDILQGDINRARAQQDLETPKPKKETPEEKFAREQRESEIVRREETMRKYKSKLPTLVAGLAEFGDDPELLKGLMTSAAQMLMDANPEAYPDLKIAAQKVQLDMNETARVMAGIGLGQGQ